MGIFYLSRERFQAAAVSNPELTSNQTIDRLLDTASRNIEEKFGRWFYPFIQTRYYDWPAQFGLSTVRLYLNADLLSVTSLRVGGASGSLLTPGTDYYLEPINYATDPSDGQYYSRIEINLASGQSFAVGTSPQRSVIVTGVWGNCDRQLPAGSLVGAINSSVTSMVLSNSAAVGVGDLVLIDTERVLVTEKSLSVLTPTLAGNLTVDKSNVTVPVSSSADLHAGEVFTIDSERMFIESISSNNLTVVRGWQGSVLAGHSSGAAIYAPRTATIARAQAGTTAASHLDAAALSRNEAPPLLQTLCLAEAISAFHQEKSGYARTVGQGDAVMLVTGRSLADIRKEAENAYLRTRGPVAI